MPVCAVGLMICVRTCVCLVCVRVCPAACTLPGPGVGRAGRGRRRPSDLLRGLGLELLFREPTRPPPCGVGRLPTLRRPPITQANVKELASSRQGVFFFFFFRLNTASPGPGPARPAHTHSAASLRSDFCKPWSTLASRPGKGSHQTRWPLGPPPPLFSGSGAGGWGDGGGMGDGERMRMEERDAVAEGVGRVGEGGKDRGGVANRCPSCGCCRALRRNSPQEILAWERYPTQAPPHCPALLFLPHGPQGKGSLASFQKLRCSHHCGCVLRPV